MISFDGSCECPINHEFDEENKECVRVELPDPCPNG